MSIGTKILIGIAALVIGAAASSAQVVWPLADVATTFPRSTLKCPVGYELVLRSTDRLSCARDFRDHVFASPPGETWIAVERLEKRVEDLANRIRAMEELAGRGQ